jgi:ferredoxin/flavodoxin
MLAIYFSATGNTKLIAELFSRDMDARCFSIEEDVDFAAEIKSHDTIAFCYPIYGSRVPRIMREFVAKFLNELSGKKVIILVTQMMFSGDGARVFTDMFWEDAIEVVYAEHFNMPNNICNTPFLRKPSKKKIQRCIKKAEKKMARVCRDIKSGIVKKRGFSRFSQILGSIQGKVWQGDSKDNGADLHKVSLEQKAKSDVRINENCNSCGLCAEVCPMKNFEKVEGKMKHKNNCTVCYRCINKCPKKAVTVLFHKKPKWQYEVG